MVCGQEGRFHLPAVERVRIFAIERSDPDAAGRNQGWVDELVDIRDAFGAVRDVSEGDEAIRLPAPLTTLPRRSPSMSSDSSVTSPVSARARRSAPTTKVDAGSRARASRINGARLRGPRTAAGKARSAKNSLKHGLCAHRFLVLPEEDAKEFKALETALLAELAPVGTLQGVLAQRVVSAAWRLMRADRMEAEVFRHRRMGDANLGLALIRDGNNTRNIETVGRSQHRPTVVGALRPTAIAPPPRPSSSARSRPSRRSRPRPPPRRPPAAVARTRARRETNPAKLAGSMT
jgi:hypothetical protein